jgi:hypothetical protein
LKNAGVKRVFHELPQATTPPGASRISGTGRPITQNARRHTGHPSEPALQLNSFWNE